MRYDAAMMMLADGEAAAFRTLTLPDRPSMDAVPALGLVPPSSMPANLAPAGEMTAAARVQAACVQLLKGDDELAVHDLLAVLLSCTMPVGQAVETAKALLKHFGSLGGTAAASPKRLRKVLDGQEVALTLLKGLHVAARRILREPLEQRPVIGSYKVLMNYLSVSLRNEQQECARILYLDKKNGLILDELHSRGTFDHAPLYPREVLRRVLDLGAAAIILVHNHPSGDPTPSPGDIAMTSELARALAAVQVGLHDHVIVGHMKQVSFRTLGLLVG